MEAFIKMNGSSQSKLIRKQYKRLCIQPVRYIEHKFMLYTTDTRHNHYLCIDPNHCVSVSSINIPHYPAINDVHVIEVEGNAYSTVADVDTDSDEVKCHPLCEVGGCNPRWKLSLLETVTHPFSNIIRNIRYDIHAGCNYLHI